MAERAFPGKEARRRELEAFGERTGIRLRKMVLLHQALTHPSFAHEHPERGAGNARLEFLGDAVLSAAISAWLYGMDPEADEGQLSRLRARVVSDRGLVELAEQFQIAPLILLGKGEKAAGPTPRILEDAMEAVVGALFLDRGFAGVEKILKPILEEKMGRLDAVESASPKNRLQERLQKNGGRPPVYRIDATEGPAHRQEHLVSVMDGVRVLGTGRGVSRKTAEEAAASDALVKLESESL